MANNQQPQGNNMAALLGNMRGQLGQQPPQAAYGGGLQPPTQQTGVYRGPLDASGKPAQAAGTYEQMPGGTFGGQPNPSTRYTPPGGWGAAMQPQGGPTPGFQNPLAGMSDSLAQMGGGWGPRPSTGAPGGGAGGGKAAGGQNPQPGAPPPQGGPSLGAPGGGAGGGKGGVKQQIGQLPGGPQRPMMGGGKGPMKRPRGPGMQANPAMQNRNPMMR